MHELFFLGAGKLFVVNNSRYLYKDKLRHRSYVAYLLKNGTFTVDEYCGEACIFQRSPIITNGLKKV